MQYLNARYHDQALGLFTSPDWFEVTQAGVGTNRFSYSFNDPMNLRDPEGNFVVGAIVGAAVSLSVDIAIGTMTGNMPSVGESAKSAAVGAVAGATGAGIVSKATKGVKAVRDLKKTEELGSGMLAGGIAGATGSTLDQAIELNADGGITLNPVDPSEVAKDTFTGMVTGGIVGGSGAGEAASGASGVASKGLNKLVEEFVDSVFGEGVNRGMNKALDEIEAQERDQEDSDYGS